MAFLAALPEVVEGAEAAGGAADAAEAGSGGGMLSKIGGLFKGNSGAQSHLSKPQFGSMSSGDEFQGVGNAVRSAVRPG